MKNIDVRVNDYIVCYDKCGMLSSPRAYWMFKIFGAKKVFILNGTFTKWKKENRPTESGDIREAWHEKRV
jgi:thiosulfate/3-mercaptopyruvate sulfurtransferase